MKSVWWRKSIKEKYAQLLTTIIILFFFGPLLEGTTGQLITSAVFLGTIITIIRTFNLKKRYFYLLLSLAGISFGLEIYSALSETFRQDKLFILASSIINSLFILAALVTINRKIFTEKKVTSDTIEGGIAVFFMIGIVWALLYRIVSILDPNAFSEVGDTTHLFDTLFYFSFTTLTTLGYGDITPISDLARTLATFEAMSGVMYPAIYIGRVVGLYTAQEMSDHD